MSTMGIASAESSSGWKLWLGMGPGPGLGGRGEQFWMTDQKCYSHERS